MPEAEDLSRLFAAKWAPLDDVDRLNAFMDDLQKMVVQLLQEQTETFAQALERSAREMRENMPRLP